MRPIIVDRILLLRHFLDAVHVARLDVHRYLLLREGVRLRSQPRDRMQRHVDVRQLLQLYVVKISLDAAKDRLMAENGDWVLLPLYPVDQRLQPADHVEVRLSAGVSEPEFVLLPVLVNFRELLLYLLVRHLFADARVHFVQDLDGDGRYLEFLQHFDGLDGPFQGRR